jgi:hypothetical protein
VENNIIYYPIVPEDISVGYDNNHDKFLRNIIVTDKAMYKFIWHPKALPWLEIDNNLLYNPKQDFFADTVPRKGKTRQFNLEEWQALGHDVHSIFADPLLADPENGDFRLSPQSPAFRLGFKEFDTQCFGLQAEYIQLWKT